MTTSRGLRKYFSGTTGRQLATAPQPELDDPLLKQLLNSLQELSCSDLKALGNVYYNATSKNKNELYHTFLELAKDMAVKVLQEDILGDRSFTASMDDAKRQDQNFYLNVNRHVNEFLQQQIRAGNSSKMDAPSCDGLDKPMLLLPTADGSKGGLCPRGYTENRLHRTCCTRDNKAMFVPLVWNSKIEATTLKSFRKALLKTIRLHTERKLFHTSVDVDKYLLSGICRDGDILQAREYLIKKKEQLQKLTKVFEKKVKPATDFVKERFDGVLTKLSGHLQTLKETTVMQRFKELTSIFTMTAKEVLNGFYKEFVENQTAAVILRKMKKHFKETICEYIVSTDLLRYETTRADANNKNYKNEFAVVLTQKYRAYLTEHALTPSDARKSLFNIFMHKFEADESIYNNFFAESLVFLLQLFQKLTYGVSGILTDAIRQTASELFKSAFEEVFTTFFYTDFGPGDVFEHLVHVFDVSTELCQNPVVVKKYPYLKMWKKKVESQIFGFAHVEEVLREKQQDQVFQTLLEENMKIMAVEHLYHVRAEEEVADLVSLQEEEFQEELRSTKLPPVVQPAVSGISNPIFVNRIWLRSSAYNSPWSIEAAHRKHGIGGLKTSKRKSPIKRL